MKNWNKSKYVRERCWHKVLVPASAGYMKKFRWCQQHPSTGKFFIDEMNQTNSVGNTLGWVAYFEDSADALAFKLQFG